MDRKSETALKLAAQAFALDLAANEAQREEKGLNLAGSISTHADECARLALKDAGLSVDEIDYISYKVGEKEMCSVENLRRFLRERRLSHFLVKPHMHTRVGDRESWSEITVWHMSDVSDTVESCRKYAKDDASGPTEEQDLFQDTLMEELLGEDAQGLAMSYNRGVGRQFAHQPTLQITKQHVVLRRHGGLDI